MDNLLLAMFSPQDIILILIVAVLVFGTKRLPEIGEAFGKTIQSFKGAIDGGQKQALSNPEEGKFPTKTEAKELPPPQA